MNLPPINFKIYKHFKSHQGLGLKGARGQLPDVYGTKVLNRYCHPFDEGKHFFYTL